MSKKTDEQPAAGAEKEIEAKEIAAGAAIGAVLKAGGIGAVFGLPGTQNLAMIDLLRRCGIPFYPAATETGAAFAAIGYQRASGRLPLVLTIPGPGALYALPGIAEAREDSIALIWAVAAHPQTGRKFGLHSIPLEIVAAPAVKKIFQPAAAEKIPAAFEDAIKAAAADEPGPVLLMIDDRMLDQPVFFKERPAMGAANSLTAEAAAALAEFKARLEKSLRPLFFLGQGALGAGKELLELAQRCGAVVTTTLSGRGIAAEDSPMTIYHDFSAGTGPGIQQLFDRADLIAAFGVKFTHNGSGGFSLGIAPEKLIHIDSAASSLNGDYPAALAILADCAAAAARLAGAKNSGGWDAAEAAALKSRVETDREALAAYEPYVRCGIGTAAWRKFFYKFFGPKLKDWIVTTDSGLHQFLIRRLSVVCEPRSLLVPADFQSMGFSIPAAIGAAIAERSRTGLRRPVAAVVGDGGLLFSLGELATIRREQLDLVLIVINDGGYGLIRRQQIERFGRSGGMNLSIPDLPALAAALGARYLRVSDAPEVDLAALRGNRGLTLVEVETVEPGSIARMKLKVFSREVVRRLLGPALIRRLKGRR